MGTSHFKKILIANRGEIALRIIRACKELGILAASVYSDADRSALHVRRADEAYHIGESKPSASYLNIEKLIKVTKDAHADAIHPGYGFLAENPEFASSVEKAGLKFIGPSADIIKKMGSKTEARKIAEIAGAPLVPGSLPLKNIKDAAAQAKKIGYPVLLKAIAGGGGKGMRVAKSPAELEKSYPLAEAEALSYFGNGSLYLEKLIESPHHIEIQILGDNFGNIIHLFERECSIQRRHQKIIEETPSPFISQKTREKICESAVKIAKAAGYTSAGTVEFLADDKENFYFLEMNTRIQVEHPITELTTGVDLVKEQIKIAAGEKLAYGQKDILPRGHAIECRIYAEDPFHNFMPSPGLVREQLYPHGPGVRVDTGIYAGFTVPIDYDPVLGKLACWGVSREEAIVRTIRALREYRISGIKTNLFFHQKVLSHEDFIKGKYDTHFVEEHLKELLTVPKEEKLHAVIALAAAKFLDDEMPNIITVSEERSQWRQKAREEGLRKWKEAIQ